MSGTRYNQFCALARAAEIVGERWTLLIIRELLLAPMRFGDLRARLGDISPALLTDRLNALTEAGMVQRTALPAPFNAQVYELTELGRAIQPGAESSLVKLAWTDMTQHLSETALAIVGDEAPLADDPWQTQWLWSKAASIAGGTSEVQKTILAERLLGLPRG